MGLPVHIGPAAPLGRREQPPVLISADRAHRGPAGMGQVLDPVLGGLCPGPGHNGGFSRATERSAPGLSRDSSRAPRASGVTGTTAWLRTTARKIASATFSGG